MGMLRAPPATAADVVTSARIVPVSCGGVNTISRGTLGVINYVYSFKHSTATQPDRVAQLTIARCNARAFGKVSCEDFPDEFQEMIFSCDAGERNEAMRLQKLIDRSVGANRQYNDATTVDTHSSKDHEARRQEWEEIRQRKINEREQARIDKCKKRLEAQIRKIDDRMSLGYTASTGEALRDRRRSLVKKMATDCQ